MDATVGIATVEIGAGSIIGSNNASDIDTGIDTDIGSNHRAGDNGSINGGGNDIDAAELLAQHILEGLGVVTRFAKSPELVHDACVLEEEMYTWVQGNDERHGLDQHGDASRLLNRGAKGLAESAVVRADAILNEFAADRNMFSRLHPWARLHIEKLFTRLQAWRNT